MGKRVGIAVGLLLVLAGGLYLAYEASQLFLFRAGFAGSYTYNLLFKTSPWVLVLLGLLGVYFGTLARRRQEIVDGKVLRHDEVAFFEHWTHLISVLVLLTSGLYLGFLFFPRLVQTPQAVGFAMNAHFVGVGLFLFSLCYYLTTTWLYGTLREHWPQPGDFQAALEHYRAVLRGKEGPQEGKYLASERLSYPIWVVLMGGIVLTGIVKVSAHVWDLPGGLMGVVTFLHDLSALGTLLFLAVHVVAAAVMPQSWPLLRSMLTGYMSEEYVRRHHAKWHAELRGGGAGGGRGAGAGGPRSVGA